MSEPNFSNKDKAIKDVDIEKPVFDIQFQAGLLKLSLKDDYFCAQLVRYLSSDEDLSEFIIFDSAQLHFIFKVICNSMIEYKTRPTEAQIRTAILEFQEDEREPYFKALEVVINADTHNEEFFRRHISSFVKQVKMAKGFKKTKSIWREHPNDAHEFLQKTIDDIRRVHFEKEDTLKLHQVYSLVKNTNDNLSKIPTGLTRLDEDMRGGFPRETLVTVLGASNAGKSIFCTSLGCSALRNGFKVLHVNLEGTRDEVLFRYSSNLADIPFQNIEENKLGEKERVKLNNVVQKYDSQLYIRNMLDFGVTIEDLISCCRETHKDFPFDVLVVDYGQLLDSKDKLEKFDRQTKVYRGLDSLSKEFKCVVISPAQSTRDGMKKQTEFNNAKRKDQEKMPVLRSSDLADCIEIARVSAVILTLNRTEEEEHRGWLRVFLEKQRRGKKALTYGVKAKYAESNLIINDYYDQNSLIHTVEDKEDPDENISKDLKNITLKSIVQEERNKTLPITAVMDSDNPVEQEYNDILVSYDSLESERKELSGKFEKETNPELLDAYTVHLKELKSKKRELKAKAKLLLPKFMPTASQELYNTIKESVRDKKSNSDGTVTQNTKTELILRQLSLVFE
jgi:replicative DNA helicase